MAGERARAREDARRSGARRSPTTAPPRPRRRPSTPQGTPAPGDDETLAQFEEDGAFWPDVVKAAVGAATPVTRTLADIGCAWAEGLGAFDAGYSWTCFEATGLARVDGYPYVYVSGARKPKGKLVQQLADPSPWRELNISHLCHNILCVNPAHLVCEPRKVNQGRGACVGGRWCSHMTACLRPGAYSHGYMAMGDD